MDDYPCQDRSKYGSPTTPGECHDVGALPWLKICTQDDGDLLSCDGPILKDGSLVGTEVPRPFYSLG